MNITVKHVKQLEKKNNKAIFLGCGKSINDLSDRQIDKINSEFDVWTSNCFMIHKKIIPDFYHLEVKPHRNGPIVTRLTKEKRQEYKDVKWVLDMTRPYLINYVGLDNFSLENIYCYPKTYRKEENGKYKPDKDVLSVSLNASLTLICDQIINMNYDEVYFLGVDMYDREYFWTNNPEYDDVEIEDIIYTCKGEEKRPDLLHPTHKMKNFISEIFEYNNQKAYNLSSSSLLKETMNTLKLEEVL